MGPKLGILTADQVAIYVAVEIQRSGLDVKDFSEKVGIRRQTLYAFMRGELLPSKSQVEKLGLEVVYRMEGSGGIYKASELKMVLYADMQMDKLDIHDYAKKLGVTHKFVYMILNGSRPPSKGIIKTLGLETVYRIVK